MVVFVKTVFAVLMTLATFARGMCDVAPVALAAPVIAPYASSYSAHSVTHAVAPSVVPASPVVAAYSAPVPAAYSAPVPAAYSALPYPYAYPYFY